MAQEKPFKMCEYCKHSNLFNYVGPCDSCNDINPMKYPSKFQEIQPMRLADQDSVGVKVDPPYTEDDVDRLIGYAKDAVRTKASQVDPIDTAEATAPEQADPNGIDQHAPGAKLDSGKQRWSLVPMRMISGVARVLTFGAGKYTANGWQKVDDAVNRYYDAMMRHWKAHFGIDGPAEYRDPESKLPHWAHFLCNAVFLAFFMDFGPKALRKGK